MAARFSNQYSCLIQHAGDRSLVFCQVGQFVEFYGPQREQATTALRLVRVEIGRGGYAFSVGFPRRLREQFLDRALEAGRVVADVRETGGAVPGCAEREVGAVWVPERR